MNKISWSLLMKKIQWAPYLETAWNVPSEMCSESTTEKAHGRTAPLHWQHLIVALVRRKSVEGAQRRIRGSEVYNRASIISGEVVPPNKSLLFGRLHVQFCYFFQKSKGDTKHRSKDGGIFICPHCHPCWEPLELNLSCWIVFSFRKHISLIQVLSFLISKITFTYFLHVLVSASWALNPGP